MKKFLTVVFILALSFLISACDGDDGAAGTNGKTGIDGLTGPTCEYTEKVEDGACIILTGTELQDRMDTLCDSGKTWDPSDGSCS